MSMSQTLTFVFAGAATANIVMGLCSTAQSYEARDAQRNISDACDLQDGADARKVCSELESKAYREEFNARVDALGKYATGVIDIGISTAAFGISRRKKRDNEPKESK